MIHSSDFFWVTEGWFLEPSFFTWLLQVEATCLSIHSSDEPFTHCALVTSLIRLSPAYTHLLICLFSVYPPILPFTYFPNQPSIQTPMILFLPSSLHAFHFPLSPSIYPFPHSLIHSLYSLVISFIHNHSASLMHLLNNSFIHWLFHLHINIYSFNQLPRTSIGTDSLTHSIINLFL